MEYLLKYKKFINDPRVYSMCDVKEIDQIEVLMEDIIRRKVPGDIIETGVWKGGASCYMKAIHKSFYNDLSREFYLFDTFGKFPKPNKNPHLKLDELIHPVTEFLFEKPYCLEDVKNLYRKFNLLDEHVHFIQGLFENTIPVTNIDKIAILRLDSDYYDSTLLVLEHYYKKIAYGGYVIIDDYNNNYLGCYYAVHAFRDKYKIKNEIIDTHKGSVYWRI